MLDFSKPSSIINQFITSDQFKPSVEIVFNDFSGTDYTIKYSDKIISYNFYETIYGTIILASTDVGVCYLHFVDNRHEKLKEFKSYFYDYNIVEEIIDYHKIIVGFINETNEVTRIQIHVKGTEFQKLVWKSLVQIPKGKITSYSEVAKNMGNENASRAVGSAIGSNEIALLIPCHRVVQKTGKLTGFRWGNDRKKQLLIKELAE